MLRDWLREQLKFLAGLSIFALVGAVLWHVPDAYAASVLGLLIALMLVIGVETIRRVHLARRGMPGISPTYLQRLREAQEPRVTTIVQSVMQPVSARRDTTGGSTSMRALGKLYSNLADLMWILTDLGLALLMIVQIRTSVGMLVGPGLTKALIDGLPIGMIALVVANMFSGRWGVLEYRNRGLMISRISLLWLGVVAFVVFIVNDSNTGLAAEVDRLAKLALIGVGCFAGMDAFYTKGEEYRASSLTGRATQASGADSAGHLPGFSPIGEDTEVTHRKVIFDVIGYSWPRRWKRSDDSNRLVYLADDVIEHEPIAATPAHAPAVSADTPPAAPQTGSGTESHETAH